MHQYHLLTGITLQFKKNLLMIEKLKSKNILSLSIKKEAGYLTICIFLTNDIPFF